ncbi:MAG: hypothetical protein U0271_35625 [Polyangiaceae bacterium]
MHPTMTLTEALACLGLTPESTKREAREAYQALRLRREPPMNEDSLARLEVAYKIVTGSSSDSPAAPGASRRLKRRALEEALRRAAMDSSLPVPPVRQAILLLLELIADSKVKSARQLCGAIDQYVGRVGEIELSDATRAQWQLAEELCRNLEILPDALHSPIARAIRDAQFEPAKDVLVAFKAREPEEAMRLAGELRREAPRLAEAFGGWLEPATGRRWMRPTLFVVLVLFALRLLHYTLEVWGRTV